MARFIGIRHRVKQTSKNEARPTMVAIITDEEPIVYTLEDDTAELDFLKGQFPVKFRKATDGEDLSGIPEHHRVERKKKDSDDVTVMVPVAYDGFTAGDVIGMVLGGSGDRLAFALSRRGEQMGAEVYRIPPFALNTERAGADKDDDHLTLARLVATRRDLFYFTGPRDRELIKLREQLRARNEAQKGGRIPCEQRLYQRNIGKIFLSEDGRFPEGRVEDQFDALKANDKILQALVQEERKREAELRKIVGAMDVWQKIFEPVEGCGEVIAAGIIAAIGDIRRFESDAKLKAFCGVHVLSDGRFPRQRSGSVANWSPSARQALYLLADQFNRRPDSVWGQKLRAYKVKLREKHPEVVVDAAGKKRYTNGHIHKMAIWRTLTKFVEWLHREWTALESSRESEEAAA